MSDRKEIKVVIESGDFHEGIEFKMYNDLGYRGYCMVTGRY